MLSVAPTASALSTPKAPKSVKYISDYAVQEHCLTFKPSSGGATGYHVQVVNASGKVTSNQYYKSTRKDKVFYKLGDEYVVWCNNNFNKYIANGQFYTVKVRAFNASNYHQLLIYVLCLLWFLQQLFSLAPAVCGCLL